jgi:glyoxylase-like metal-dependent hydrolase (beta-lactamase superfamily II)
MLGKITLTPSDGLKIHTYTAPEEGWCVNSHIIELPSQLITVDAQYMLPYAREVVSYAETLNKPIARLYISHYHPDHLLGAAAFSAPMYSLPEVKDKIEAVGDRVAREENEKHGDAIPTHAERPSELVRPGEEILDGVQFQFFQLQHAETENALMIGLPDHRILITQDLVYNHVHVFIAERAFDSWLGMLRYYEVQPFTRVLPGHGAPGGKELYEGMAQYLCSARELLAKASNGDGLKASLIAAFPGFGGCVLLDHQKRFLFPPAKERKDT